MYRRQYFPVIAAAMLAVLPAAVGQPRLGARVEDLEVLKCRQRGGVKPEYDHYRLSALRYYVTAGWESGPVTFGVAAGQADLTTHSSEGETTEFDPVFLWGGFAAVEWSLPQVPALDVRLSTIYLHYEPDNEKVTSTPKHSRSTGGDLSVEWSEWKVAAELVKNWGEMQLSVGPVWQDLSIDQDRAYPDRTVASSFDPDDDLGLQSRLRWRPSERVTADLTVELVHRSAFSLGVAYRF